MNRVVFLDRDGVINEDPMEKLYVTKWEDFKFLPGSKEALKILNESGYKVAIISNQAGISKGLFTTKQLYEVTDKMLDEIKRSGGNIDSVNYCIHKSDDNCSCRKPKTGLFEQAAKSLGANSSYYIGDSKRDIEAGKSFGCKTILVLSGKASKDEVSGWDVKPDFIKKDLLEAVNFIITNPKS